MKSSKARIFLSVVNITKLILVFCLIVLADWDYIKFLLTDKVTIVGTFQSFDFATLYETPDEPLTNL